MSNRPYVDVCPDITDLSLAPLDKISTQGGSNLESGVTSTHSTPSAPSATAVGNAFKPKNMAMFHIAIIVIIIILIIFLVYIVYIKVTGTDQKNDDTAANSDSSASVNPFLSKNIPKEDTKKFIKKTRKKPVVFTDSVNTKYEELKKEAMGDSYDFEDGGTSFTGSKVKEIVIDLDQRLTPPEYVETKETPTSTAAADIRGSFESSQDKNTASVVEIKEDNNDVDSDSPLEYNYDTPKDVVIDIDPQESQSSENALLKSFTDDNMQCSIVLKSGKNKGKRCSLKVVEDGLCKRHLST